MTFFSQNYFYKSFLCILFIFFFQKLSAQEKCGTVHYNQIREAKIPHLKDESDFENFIKEKSLERKSKNFPQNLRTSEIEPLVIPVVVHIIHKGEPVSSGVNLSMERILSQIKTLNEDYRRLNADTIFTPTQYLDVATDTEIEFRLATSDPQGFATNGVVRIKGTQIDWTINDDASLKEESYWPAEDYLNIWVTDLANDLLGYSQFPESDLEGLEFSSTNRLTDGVVIDYEYFGENAGDPKSTGRTTTHEIGHFLGLRHVWGDGGCSEDDYCEDTPGANAPNYNCTTEHTSCGSRDMYENYMDYTSDVCMNLFTVCQKNRMKIVLENSPRRKSLVTSPGLQEPALVEDDAAISTIVSPNISSCESEINPEIVVLNNGLNDVSSVRVELYVNEVLEETKNVILNLAPGEKGTISFSNYSFSNKGPHKIRFQITRTNNTTDNNPFNNTKDINFYIRTEGILPVSEPFIEFPEDWLILNPDENVTWSITTLADNNNQVAHMNFFNYSENTREFDYLLSPSYDFSDLVSATLTFKVAYAPFPEVEEDGLAVIVSKDCGNTFPEADVLYRKYGSALATAPATENEFFPSSRSDWRTETLDLLKYMGDPNIQIAFLGQNGFGNNLFIDDVEIEIKRRVDLDITILDINKPSAISCNERTAPQIEIQNQGKISISSFTLSQTIEGASLPSYSYNGPVIAPGEKLVIDLPELDVSSGSYEYVVQIIAVNNTEDQYPEDNSKLLEFVVNNEKDIIPLRETFEPSFVTENRWTILNPDNGPTWQLSSPENRNLGGSLVVRNYSYDAVGEEDWLVSPVLDFSTGEEASLFFSVAHAYHRNYPDKLEVRVSTDCGETFPFTVYSKSGEDLATDTSTEEWFPSNNTGYRREFVDLTEFRNEENVRVAFVNTTHFGNSTFIDDIEFFISADPSPVPGPENNFILYPNPADDYFSATFNLSQRQNVTLYFYNNVGKEVFRKSFPNTLNQTYDFDLFGVPSGVYLLRIQGDAFHNTRRIIVN